MPIEVIGSREIEVRKTVKFNVGKFQRLVNERGQGEQIMAAGITQVEDVTALNRNHALLMVKGPGPIAVLNEVANNGVPISAVQYTLIEDGNDIAAVAVTKKSGDVWPLAKAIREELKKLHSPIDGVYTVAQTELPVRVLKGNRLAGAAANKTGLKRDFDRVQAHFAPGTRNSQVSFMCEEYKNGHSAGEGTFFKNIIELREKKGEEFAKLGVRALNNAYLHLESHPMAFLVYGKSKVEGKQGPHIAYLVVGTFMAHGGKTRYVFVAFQTKADARHGKLSNVKYRKVSTSEDGTVAVNREGVIMSEEETSCDTVADFLLSRFKGEEAPRTAIELAVTALSAVHVAQ